MFPNYHLLVENDQRDNLVLGMSTENTKQELAQTKKMLDEREKRINELEGKLNEQLNKQNEMEELNKKDMNEKLSALEVSHVERVLHLEQSLEHKQQFQMNFSASNLGTI